MAGEYNYPPESDLEKTDRLPILEGTQFDPDVADDAVPMDHTAVLGQSDILRPSSVDLPSLAESVRSVEQRITRQNAEFESLTRAYERARDAETALGERTRELKVELAAARATLESEQGRARELERVVAERSSAIETARARIEQALRESERHEGEARTLRDSLAARDAHIAKVLHSLEERDAQLSALQQEHAKTVPALEANVKSAAQLDADLRRALSDAQAVASELQASRQTVAELTAQLKRSESDMNAARAELGAAKIQANSYLDLLRTRDWRRGFDQNLFRELDAQLGAARSRQGALEKVRERLQRQVAKLEARLAAQSVEAQKERAQLTAQSAEAQKDRAQLVAQLAARDRPPAVKPEAAGDAAGKAALQAAELRRAEQAAQIAQLRAEQATQNERLQSEARTHGEEMAVLRTQLRDAQQLEEQRLETQRPIQSMEADISRLTSELADKTVALVESEDENRRLRSTLERTRSALEEREFLIRRLERSESADANVLGRIQTSIERLGSVPVASNTATAGPTAEWSAELIRIDGGNPVTHVLSRRTRIGRAAGCELQIDSSSVSRHHALIMVGSRETIIEDLNSTNGVLVNGRKVTRVVLNDGDALTFGETQFRYVARPLPRPPESKPAEPAAKA